VALYFHNEGIDYKYREKDQCRKWIQKVVTNHHATIGYINIIFTSTPYLLKLNQEYLKHNYHTDVITFDYSEGDTISGDIFIGIEKVLENSDYYEVNASEELRRVIIHGVLHLLGFSDQDDTDRKKMKEMENNALTLWNQ
jgi:rRNA maturation RNase YbeY